MKNNLRAIAAIILVQVMQGRSLSQALNLKLDKLADSRDRGFVQALCYGVSRWFFQLDHICKNLLEKPLKQKDNDIYILLLIGLYQLIDMHIPPHAAVDETVAAVQNLKKIWAKGLVNKILREFLRKEADLTTVELMPEEAHFSHPSWMIEKLKEAYPDHWQSILIANNEHPPFSLRVNQTKLSVETYLDKLSALGLKANLIPGTTSGIQLQEPIHVKELPGFFEGEVSVQDGAAQLAAPLLNLEPAQLILDACAAPGGKTSHMLELQPTLICVAIDHDPKRLALVEENLQRLKLKARCLVADVANVQVWWDGQLFDRILLDAPCSGSGVIRRHPDIKLLRRATDITPLSETQLRLLNALWHLLKPGGLLLYSTCSVFPEENEHVVERFMELREDAQAEKTDLSFGLDRSVGKQILPGQHGMDGFFYSQLRKLVGEKYDAH